MLVEKKMSVEIKKESIGRRFTIEPKPERSKPAHHHQADPDAPAPESPPVPRRSTSPGAITGIRLFPGNALIVSRKFGSFRNQLVAAMSKQDLRFTVTEHGLEPEAFIRVIYNCPRGIFVQTVRNDEEEAPAKSVIPEHHLVYLDRQVGQSLIIRANVNPVTAVDDLEKNGVFVSSWFDVALGRVRLQVAATEAWDVLTEEDAPPRAAPVRRPQVVREDSREFLLAFFQEAGAYLDGEEMDLLKEKAKTALWKGNHTRP